ncbi:MAG: diguanylate cyclase [Gemmataceae bacterium]
MACFGGYRCSILIVDDDPAILRQLQLLLEPEFELALVDSAEAAKELLSQRKFDILLADHQLPGESGVQLLDYVTRSSPQTIGVLMTGISRLEDAIEAINCGRVHRYLFKPWQSEQVLYTIRQAARSRLLEQSHEELLKELRRFNLELEKKVHQRTLELKEANRLLHQKNLMLTRMALTDPLTGLPNRRAMDRLGKNEIVRRTRYPSSFAIGLLDVDHFHDVNAVYSLSGGDQALIWLAQAFGAAVRTVDTVGRVGGEEFMVVAPETDEDGAWLLAERMRIQVESGAAPFGQSEIRLTVSIGMAVVASGISAGYDQIRHLAAEALAEAKAKGRNRSILKVMATQSVAR